jgi:hypothetical protein
MQKTALVTALFLGILVAGLLARYFMTVMPPKAKEGFVQKEFAPVSGTGMGPYDQVSMPGVSGWAATEPAPVSTSPVGSSQEPRIMFLADVKTSPSCCPSAFNTDTGCVCLSSEERAQMASRGGNRAM